MSLHRRDILKFLSYSMAGLATSLRPWKAYARPSEVIQRDVCVLGGGSSGTFTAVRLRDSGKSVVVLERKDRLGGHCETYTDPATGIPVDYGVVVFHNLPVVTSYFARFNVPLIALSLGGSGPTEYFDYRTGRQVVGYAPPSQAEVGQALTIYYEYLLTLKATYYDLDSGFDLPTPVPPDLLMTFGDFVKKYSLQALVSTVFMFGQGLGNLLEMPTVYVLKNFSAQVVNSIFTGQFMTVPTGNSQIYLQATQFLGDDVLFGATVQRVERHHDGVTIYADTLQGPRVIQCKKLVVTCPPTPQNLQAFELDAHEASTLGRFRSNFYWTSLVTLSGFPAGLSVANTGANTLYNLPPLPGIYSVAPTRIPGLYAIKYGSATCLDDAEVRERIVADVHRLNDSQSFPTPPRVTAFKTFSAHNPFELRVTPNEIAGGFYTALESLQGRNHTFYNGAAFHTHDSSLLWQFTNDHVLPLILA
jgi:hypothetical protein